MEYERFYTKFERPPLAPIYRPTSEEFADPIAYVAKIRPHAEQYGVVKIIPPANFKPPFVIDTKSFSFNPRVQHLNEIEALVREKLIFLERLAQFWTLQGKDYVLPTLDGRHIDLFRFQRVVKSMGGSEVITAKKQWSTVLKRMNIKSNIGAGKVRDLYVSHIEPMERLLTNVSAEEETDEEDEEEENKPSEPCKPTMQGRRRAHRPSGRMMAGLARKTKVTKKKAPPKKEVDPMENVFCLVCNRGDDEDHLMLCEVCDSSMHTTCCNPPLDKVPSGSWHCPKCVAAQIRKIGSNYGFYDQPIHYTIKTFEEYGHQFKKEYFGVDHLEDITDSDVENEFWRKVIDSDHTVAVKYGADLISSSVGSGFPRKGDVHRGSDSRLRGQYANHPWNLNNMPVVKESVLSHIDTKISGMMVPWVYVGMCFSTFCWHTEDHWTYSVNYNHWGERKIWYGIGGGEAEKFEKVVRELAPNLTSQRDIFHHMTTAVNPALLRSKGVKVTTVQQNAGEFVITFPRAYHAGFNEGVNFAEAVNFAPVDWLPMGRSCITEYGNVRRFCVFSHDELVVKMVQQCDKLGIDMTLTAQDEVLNMLKRQQVLTSMILKNGVRNQVRENFEGLPDDERVCRHCKTTLFLSALTCQHKRTVCLEHLDQLCLKCTFGDCVLRYRFLISELEDMVAKLESRTKHYYAWSEDVRSSIHGHEKPTLYTIEHLLETGRQKKFPNTPLMQELSGIHRKCVQAVDQVNAVVGGKIKTRKETRQQRADTRLGLEGIRELIEELHDLPCDMTIHIQKLNDVVSNIEQWKEDVKVAIKEAQFVDGGEQRLQEIMRRGESFDVKIEELDELHKASESVNWRARAIELINWEAHDDMEEAEDFEDHKRWDDDSVLKMIREGSDLMKIDEDIEQLVNDLHSKYKLAVKYDNLADRILSSSKQSATQLEELWKSARGSDWFTAKAFDWMRREICQMRYFSQVFDTEEMTWSQLNKHIDRCQRSKILSTWAPFEKLRGRRDALQTFTTHLTKLFQRVNSYYSLAEIVRDRFDFAQLLEGQVVERKLHRMTNAEDEWQQLSEFNSADDLHAHLEVLKNQQELLHNLQTKNNKMKVEDTCVCATDQPSSSGLGSQAVTCILCRAKYHASCCEWDNFLDRLPNGSFLCVRCLRSKRPCMEDVQAACNQGPKNSIEVLSVRSLLRRAQEYTSRFIKIVAEPKIANSNPDALDPQTRTRIQLAVEEALRCEISNLDVLPKLCIWISRIYSELLESQKSVCEFIREQPSLTKPPETLFVPKKGKKRPNVVKEPKKERKRSKAVYHSDDQTCSADTCLRPYGDQVGWVQCEAECSRWYHFLCVGQTVSQVQSLEKYICYRCEVLDDEEEM